MFGRLASALAIALASLAVSAPVAAQDAVSLAGDVRLIRVVEEAGTQKETLVEPTQVVPGDRLVFTTTYTNNSGEPVDDFVVTNPLPDAVMLAETGDFQVSVDGGASFGALSAASVEDAGQVRAAALADVTHIRWTVPRVEAGATGKVTYFAVVR